MTNSQPDNRKALGAVLAAGGAILIVLAVVRFNSIESQLIRGFGGSDGPATTMLVIGIPLALIGVAGFFRASQEAEKGVSTSWSHIQAKNDFKDGPERDFFIEECGKAEYDRLPEHRG